MKPSYSEVKRTIEDNSECKLLSEEYINSKTDLKLLCHCGDPFNRNFDTIKNKQIKNGTTIQCKKCSTRQSHEKQKHDDIFIRNKIENELHDDIELKWVYGDYKNDRSKLTLIDNHRYMYKSAYINLKNNKPHMTKANPFAVYNLNMFLMHNDIFNIKVISRKNDKSRFVKIKCDEGHICNISIDKLMSRKRCPECNKSKNRIGEKHPNWKGGITGINQYLHKQIDDWKQESIKHCNYKCVLTGDRFDVIHHKHAFSLILQETLEVTKLSTYKNSSEYSNEELELITNTCKKLHEKYGHGACLRGDVHKLFHSIYGYDGNNTIQQWQEFEKDFKNGKYNHLIKHNAQVID